MKKTLYLTVLMLFLVGIPSLYAQIATVFSDDFTTSAGTSYTSSAGAIVTSTNWNLSISGADFGAKIDGGILNVTNDASSAGNASGWALASTSIATFFLQMVLRNVFKKQSHFC